MSDSPATDPTPAPGDVLAEQGLDAPKVDDTAAAPAADDTAPVTPTDTSSTPDDSPPDPPSGVPAPADPINDAKADYHAAPADEPVVEEPPAAAAPLPLEDYLNPELAIHANALGLDLNTVVRDAIDAAGAPPADTPAVAEIDEALLTAADAKGIDVNQLLAAAIADADSVPAEGQLADIQTQAAADLEAHAAEFVGSTSEGPALAASHLASSPAEVIIGGPNLRGGTRITDPADSQPGDQIISASPLIIWRPDQG